MAISFDPGPGVGDHAAGIDQEHRSSGEAERSGTFAAELPARLVLALTVRAGDHGWSVAESFDGNESPTQATDSGLAMLGVGRANEPGSNPLLLGSEPSNLIDGRSALREGTSADCVGTDSGVSSRLIARIHRACSQLELPGPGGLGRCVVGPDEVDQFEAESTS